VTRLLALHRWGRPDAPRVIFLHGVTSHGRHFRELAERWLLDRFDVLAPDLLGHGTSSWDPPWSIEAQLESVVATTGREPAVWVGHSFGGRLAFELAANEPALVERLILLDPAVHLAGHVALFAAEHARHDRVYGSFDEAIERRYDESQLHGAPRELLEKELRDHIAESGDGRWRYRYCQSAVVSTYGELASPPPPFDAVRVPTLLLLGERSYLPYDHLLEHHTRALGDLLQVERVPGGHTVLWDALDETGHSIERFLISGRTDPAPPSNPKQPNA
jgi:lipase